MEDNYASSIVISKFRRSTIFVYFLLAFGALFLAGTIVKIELDRVYYTYEAWAICGLLLIVAIGILVSCLLRFQKIMIGSGEIQIRRLWGDAKIIPFEDVLSWKEGTAWRRISGSFDILQIYTKHARYQFTSEAYRNYPEMLEAIKKIDPVQPAPGPRYPYRGAILAVVIGVVFFGSAIIILLKSNKPIVEPRLVRIQGVITNQPEIDRPSRGEPSSIINLQEYPGFIFRIDGAAMAALATKYYVNQFQTGDTLQLEINKENYETLIHPRPPGSFLSMSDLNIETFGVSAKGKTYLSFTDYKEQYLSKRNAGDAVVYLIILGVAALVVAYIAYRMAKEKIY